MKSNAELTYAFVEELIDGIEKFSAAKKAADPAVFSYRGRDLKHAVERSLFFRFTWDRRFISFYIAQKRGEAARLNACGELENEFAESLFRTRAPQQKIRRSLYLQNHLIHSAIFFGYILWRLALSALQKRRCAPQGATMFYLTAEKFVRFAKPLSKKLQNAIFLNPLVKNFFCVFRRYSVAGAYPLSLRSFGRHPASAYLKRNFPMLLRQFDYLHFAVSKLKPARLVVAEGVGYQDEVANQVCADLRIPCFCLQYGWSAYAHNGFRNMSFSAFLSWGQGFSDLLRAHNPKQTFIETGNHVLEIETQSQLSRNGIAFMLSGIGEPVSEELFLQSLEFLLWSLSSFPSMPHFIREHPAFPLSSAWRKKISLHANAHWRSAADFPLSKVFAESRVLVSIFSSTILEGLASGVFPLIVNCVGMARFSPDLDSMGLAREVKSFEQAKTALQKLLSQSAENDFAQRLAAFRKTYFAAFGAEAVARIVRAIEF